MCILNIGGISNNFWDGNELIGFDTGPETPNG